MVVINEILFFCTSCKYLIYFRKYLLAICHVLAFLVFIFFKILKVMLRINATRDFFLIPYFLSYPCIMYVFFESFAPTKATIRTFLPLFWWEISRRGWKRFFLPGGKNISGLPTLLWNIKCSLCTLSPEAARRDSTF